MECENCEDSDVRALWRAVPVVAILAAAGLGACAQRRHRKNSYEDTHAGDDQNHDARWRHHEHEHQHEDRHRGHRFYGPLKRGTDPLHILERRFASGEIDEDEFRRRRRVLSDEVD